MIEDSALLRGMLGEMLEEMTHVVVVDAVAGENAAIERIASGEVDLAIVDLELDEGSGFGVLQHLGAAPDRFGGTRAVVLSTYAHRAIRKRCEQLGAEAFFDKASGMDDLLDFVERAAGEDRPRS
ncbi:response regulator [Azoarcus sp. L1K30]|uniref:response regulator n=1 Tax=Azoarcus sp. L1K30 TaxID=2820277 RepID=UPI0032C23B4C